MGTVTLLISAASVFVSERPARADSSPDYRHENVLDNIPGPWMSRIRDDARLSQLSIPGTHDSASNGAGGDIVQTQASPIANQLLAGVRFLDARVFRPADENVLHMYHGFVYLGTGFEDLMHAATTFLKLYPTETIVMRIKQEHSSTPDEVFSPTVQAYLDRYSQYVWQGGKTVNPTLGEIRGKIVVARNFEGSSVGVAYPRGFDVSDDYHLATNWSLYDKWEGVKRHVQRASSVAGTPTSRPYLTYLSGSGGSLPYFVASGRSGPGTLAPPLATGLTTPGFAGWYPDFPRTGCFIGICTIAFKGTNALTADLIRAHQPKYVGIVVADFPGSGLIAAVISANRGLHRGPAMSLRPSGTQ